MNDVNEASATEELSTLYSETTPEGGVLRLSKWPEGYVLWHHGKIVFRSWIDVATQEITLKLVLKTKLSVTEKE